MEKMSWELLLGLALIIVLSSSTGLYAVGYLDSDGDGVVDNQDAFPYDLLESKDSDGDGVGDNTDAFPYDSKEQYDSDGDGIGDNEDAFPNNPMENKDSDGDGVGDYADDFPYDPAASKDIDRDGYPDEWNELWDPTEDTTNLTLDVFPNDPSEWKDSDGDGVGDNSDKFPTDPAASIDSDDDGHPDFWNKGMNQTDSTTNLTLDVFPKDPSEWSDSDRDGVGDNSDVFPHNPDRWRDPSVLPTEIILDRTIQLSDISNGRDITYDGTYYYIIDYNVSNGIGRVFRFYSDFSFTGVVWNFTQYIEYPTGITYYDNHIYIIGRKHEEAGSHIFKFSMDGKLELSSNISPYISYARAITRSNDHLYICDSKSGKKSIHVFDASTLTHIETIDISHYPSDIIVCEEGNWYLINDHSIDVTSLYLHKLGNNKMIWSKSFVPQKIEFVNDNIIGLSGNTIYIYKLF